MKKTIWLLLALMVVMPSFAENKITAANYFKLGAAGGLFTMSDKNFKDAYGSGGFSGLVSVSYVIAEAWEPYVQAGYFTKKGTLPLLEEELTFTAIPVYVGLRYHIPTKSAFTPFIGLGGGIFFMREKLASDAKNPDFQKPHYAVSLNAGAHYALNDTLDLTLDAKYDMGKYTVTDTTDKADLAGLRLYFGLSVNL